MDANRKRIWHRDIFEPTEFLTADMEDYHYPAHIHDVFSLQAVDIGAQEFQTKRGKETLPPRTLTVINPDEIHSGWRKTETRWRYRMIYPSTALVGRCLDIETEQAERLGFTSHVIDDPDLLVMFDRVHGAAANAGDFLEMEHSMIVFLRALFTRHADFRPIDDPPCPRVAAECRSRLDAHFQDNLKLETLAAMIGVSEAHVVRSFTKFHGISPGAYRTARRVEQAKKLLLSGASIAKTASDLGFYDQSHFHKAFRKIVGVTPGRFAQANRVSAG